MYCLFAWCVCLLLAWRWYWLQLMRHSYTHRHHQTPPPTETAYQLTPIIQSTATPEAKTGGQLGTCPLTGIAFEWAVAFSIIISILQHYRTKPAWFSCTDLKLDHEIARWRYLLSVDDQLASCSRLFNNMLQLASWSVYHCNRKDDEIMILRSSQFLAFDVSLSQDFRKLFCGPNLIMYEHKPRGYMRGCVPLRSWCGWVGR